MLSLIEIYRFAKLMRRLMHETLRDGSINSKAAPEAIGRTTLLKMLNTSSGEYSLRPPRRRITYFPILPAWTAQAERMW